MILRKIVIVLLLAFLSSAYIQAKSVKVSGKLVDNSDKQPLVGAYVSLQRPSDSTKIYAVSDVNGQFLFKQVASGHYQLQAHCVGYKDSQFPIEVKQGDLNLNTVKMKIEAIELGGVQTTAVQARVQMNGDTIQMNADAYKTNENASASDLVKKMPSIVVTNGQVQAQGENVTKVLVNGKEFFGNDPNAALNNLPASAIQSINIYDDESEQSKLTGVSNGNTIKTMNIVLRPGMNKGVFGKLSAGGGTQGKYTAGGNINIFNDEQRISIVGLSNNINVQNFSSDDLLGVTASSQSGGGGRRRGRSDDNGSGNFLVSNQGGISTTNSLGLNYQDVIAKKITVAASYFFNRSNNNNETKTYQNYFTNNQNYYSLQTVHSLNTNQRFNLKMDYKIDDNNLLRLITRFSSQHNTQSSTLNTTLKDSTGTQLTSVDNDLSSDKSGMNWTNQLMYQHKFNKPGRIFVANFTGNLSPKTGTSTQYSLTNSTGTTGNNTDTLNQLSKTNNGTNSYGVDLNYTEPLSITSSIIGSLHYDRENNKSEKLSYNYSAEAFDYTLIDTALSNVYNNDFNTKSGQLGYDFHTEKVHLSTELQYQNSSLDGDQTFPLESKTTKSYNALLPMLRLRYRITDNQKLSLTYRTNTKNPSSNQLQNAVNNNNPLQLSTGNPNLNQQYSHNIFLRYASISKDKTSTLFAMLMGSVANNYITSNSSYASSDTTINGIRVSKGSYLTRPENINGYQSFRGFMGYGMPITSLKSNFNINANASYTKTPGLIDGVLNNTRSEGYGVGLVLSSNISENVDFTLSTSSQRSLNSNTLGTSAPTKYFNQNSSANLDWTFGPAITFQTRLSHQYNAGYDPSVKKNMFICNVGLGKKFFHERGLLSLNVYDLFKQNNSISQTSTDYYQQQQESLSLQRYFMLTFTYLIKNFKEGSAPKKSDDDRPWSHPGGRMHGGGGHMY